MQFFIDHSMFAALVVALIVMLGVLFYLLRLDARLRKMESSLARVVQANGHDSVR